MECAEVREEFSALIDGELAPEQRAGVEAHLAHCSDCLRELDRIKRIDVLYRALTPQVAPSGFEEGVRKAALVSARRHARPRMRPWPRLLPVLAVAAVLLVVLGAAVMYLGQDRSLMRVASVQLTAEHAAPTIAAETADQLKALGYMPQESAAASRGVAPAAAAPSAEPAPVEKPSKTGIEAESRTPQVILDVTVKQDVTGLKGGANAVSAKPKSAPAKSAKEQATGGLGGNVPATAAGGYGGGGTARLKSEAMAGRRREVKAESAEPLPAAPVSRALEAPSAAPPPAAPSVVAQAPAAAPPSPAVTAESAAAERSLKAVSKSPEIERDSRLAEVEAAGRYITRADSLREQGELNRAVENYRYALGVAPSNVDAMLKLGETLVQQDKKEEALRYLSEAVRIEPRNTAAQCSLARALESAGRVDEAAEHFQKALDIDPACAQAKEGLERLKAGRKKQ